MPRGSSKISLPRGGAGREDENTEAGQPLSASVFASAEKHTLGPALSAAYVTGPRHPSWSSCPVCSKSTKGTLP